MTENERKEIMNLADTINGEINRMCVTNELSEFVTMCGYAKKNLDKLAKIYLNSRFGKEEDRRITKSEIKAIMRERAITYCAILEAIPVWYHNRKFKMQCDIYASNDNLSIRLLEVGEGPFCSLTVNISDLPPELFALDTNNFPEAEIFCIANRIAKPTKKILTSGYCRYPVYELEPEIVKCCNKLLKLKEENTNGSKEDNKEI